MGNDIDDFNPFSAKSNKERRKEGTIRAGLRGWLIVFAVVVIGIPALRLFLFIDSVVPDLMSGTRGSDSSATFKLATFGFLLLAEIALIFMFFRQMRLFPKLYMAICFLRIALLVFGFFILSNIAFLDILSIPLRPYLIIGAVIAFNLILVLYLWSSERVEATFIK